MPRPRDPEVRARIIDRAAHMLRVREPVTLRSLVEGTGVSTMAVYTHFGGMDGLWSAVRQEGFRRLADRLAKVTGTDDPVRDLVALGAAYVANAVEGPDLYRVMFDAGFELEDPEQADRGLGLLVQAVDRARSAGRFGADVDPAGLATEVWIVGHGLASLVAAGPLPAAALGHAVPMLTALYVGAGDEPARCRRSVELGWQELQG